LFKIATMAAEKLTTLESQCPNFRGEADLQAFIDRNKLGTEDLETVRGMLRQLFSILARSGKIFDEYNDFIHIGGSLSKGTSIKNSTDADIVIFKQHPYRVSNPKEMEKLIVKMKTEMITELTELFAKQSGMEKEKWEEEGKTLKQDEELSETGINSKERPRVKISVTGGHPSDDWLDVLDLFDKDEVPALHFSRSNKFLITLEMTSLDGKLILPVDILPVYDWERQFSTLRDMEKFFSLLRAPGLVSSNLTTYHTEFVMAKLKSFGKFHSLVKDLIIVCKYWFKSDVKAKFPSAKFPSYAIELLCLGIAAKEIMRDNSILSLFFKFLHVVQNHQTSNLSMIPTQIKINHRKHQSGEDLSFLMDSLSLSHDKRMNTSALMMPVYTLQEIPSHIIHQHPLIIDPANKNVGSAVSWPEVGCAARITLNQFLHLNKDLWEELRKGNWSLAHEELTVEGPGGPEKVLVIQY